MGLAINPCDPEPENDPDPCPQCGSYDREWEACGQCGGEGFFDLHDEDPINFSPGEEYETCNVCRGHGGYLICHGCIKATKAVH